MPKDKLITSRATRIKIRIKPSGLDKLQNTMRKLLWWHMRISGLKLYLFLRMTYQEIEELKKDKSAKGKKYVDDYTNKITLDYMCSELSIIRNSLLRGRQDLKQKGVITEDSEDHSMTLNY